MEQETRMLDRIIALEKEVSDLRSEVQHLKQHTSFEPAKKALTPTYVATIKPEHEEVPVRTNPVQFEEPVLNTEKKRSLEEMFTRALPRILKVFRTIWAKMFVYILHRVVICVSLR